MSLDDQREYGGPYSGHPPQVAFWPQDRVLQRYKSDYDWCTHLSTVKEKCPGIWMIRGPGPAW